MPEGKVITLFERRQEIEEALLALARARTEEESAAYLEALSQYGSDVLPILIGFLDTPDPWMVRALGRVAAQVEDRPRAVEALRRAVLSEESSDRRRIVALVMLDQFLEQPLDEALFSALGNPTEVAVRALLADRSIQEPMMRMDYLSIIHAQPPNEVQYALRRFREDGSDQAIEALRFLAMDERDRVAETAIEALGTIRRPAALHALQVLEPNVASFRRPLVERMQRKLRLSGVPDPPLPPLPTDARVLISSIDGSGNRLLLFLLPQGEHYRVLHLFLDDTNGLQGAYEMTLLQAEIPQTGPIGTVYSQLHPWEGVLLLEGTFPYARRLLTTALEYNEARGTYCPLEYRFFCDQVWGWSTAEEREPSWPTPPEPEQDAMAVLLRHPALSSWFLGGEAIEEAAEGLAQATFSRSGGQGLLALATVSLVSTEFSAVVCLRYARRLQNTAEWLLRAGERELAAVALSAAEELTTAPPLQSLFALVLMQRSLLLAAGRARMAEQEG